MRQLTPLEARVLGVLVEKQHTVPDTYPLSLNALTAGCNQKTARDPVMNATEAEVALLTLLMLRGPQTAAELRLHTERLHRFADISSVEAFLDELATKEPPRVVKLARAPGE